MNNKEKIIIALSGGIDSAFSAHLVKNNFPTKDISAVFMQNWDDFLADNRIAKQRCTQTEDWEDAQKVASFLNIKISKKEFINEYWNKVFVSFLSKIQSGATPNPDVLCNSLIKFAHFIKYAREELKADYLVTGHYARIVYDSTKGIHYLAKSRDENKDQTYFLCQIDRAVLPFIIFPLGEFKKEEVKNQTLSLGFPNVQRKESMGICFIGDNNFEKFISNYITEESGDFIDAESKLSVGKHRGTSFYTIGQRKGLGLGGQETPYYVIGKNVDKRIIYVAKGAQNPLLYSAWCVVKEINWLIPENEVKMLDSKDLTAKFRHRQEEVGIKLFFEKENLKSVKVVCKEPTKALTPGQYAVFYSGELCLGGGAVFCTEKLDERACLL